MNDVFEIKFQGAEELLAKYLEGPERIREILEHEMLRQMQQTADLSRTNYLSGDPLHRRSGQLSRSINPKASSTATEVTGSVGTNLPYGAVHEYGGTITIAEHMRRTGRAATGERMKLLTKGGKVRAGVHHTATGTVRAHTATYPERSFLRAPLTQRREEIMLGLRRAALAELQK